jgi:beta-lactamase class A
MTGVTARLMHELKADLDAAGLRGWFLVRDLRTGEEIGIEPDVRVPLASVVKVPLAVAVLDRVASGVLSEATPLRLEPGRSQAIGPVGVTKFHHPAQIALGDVLYLSTSLRDSAAADALFELVPPSAVTQHVQKLGIDGLIVRHRMAELTEPQAEVHVQDDGAGTNTGHSRRDLWGWSPRATTRSCARERWVGARMRRSVGAPVVSPHPGCSRHVYPGARPDA